MYNECSIIKPKLQKNHHSGMTRLNQKIIIQESSLLNLLLISLPAQPVS